MIRNIDDLPDAERPPHAPEATNHSSRELPTPCHAQTQRWKRELRFGAPAHIPAYVVRYASSGL